MAFADPQSVTISGSAVSLPNVERAGRRALYTSSDQTVSMTLSHVPQKSKGREKTRTLAQLTKSKIVTDPISTDNVTEDLKISFILERPNYGFSEAEILALSNALCTWLTANSSANVSKLAGQES